MANNVNSQMYTKLLPESDAYHPLGHLNPKSKSFFFPEQHLVPAKRGNKGCFCL